ncbi:unnamed protein product [Gongylonema pulchrum]|uniref:ZnMc domain-containing protein n=1 Tax=Gongylonema pulchrum TaxID=637853 RepID=A0A183EA16_9BILA|nr:unnamed protein product [Gongylonema pulchrum]
MQQKRCGRMDIMELRRDSDAYKWKNSDLTYSIDSYPNELSQREVRQAVKQAFDTWSAVTPLRFSEIARRADIQIAFARRVHNDPWPFDGRGGVLAHATLPPSGLLHFDLDEKWAYMNPGAIASFSGSQVSNLPKNEGDDQELRAMNGDSGRGGGR